MFPCTLILGILLPLPASVPAQFVGRAVLYDRELGAETPKARIAKSADRPAAAWEFPTKSVASIAVSPDGRWIATGDNFKQVWLWDRATGEAKWRLHGHGCWITRLEFSADSAYLLASHDCNSRYRYCWELVVWNVATGKLARYHDCMDWSLTSDGKALAVGRPNREPPSIGFIQHMALSYKGFTVQIADFPSQKLRRSITHPDKPMQSLALSPDASVLAVGTAKEILLWDATTGKPLPSITGLKDEVHVLRFSPDGKVLASVSDDLFGPNETRAIEFWEMKTRKKAYALTTEDRWHFSEIVFISNQRMLAKRNLGKHELWDLEKRQFVRTFNAGAAGIFDNGKAIAHNRDDGNLASPNVFFEDLVRGKPLAGK